MGAIKVICKHCGKPESAHCPECGSCTPSTCDYCDPDYRDED